MMTKTTLHTAEQARIAVRSVSSTLVNALGCSDLVKIIHVTARSDGGLEARVELYQRQTPAPEVSTTREPDLSTREDATATRKPSSRTKKKNMKRKERRRRKREELSPQPQPQHQHQDEDNHDDGDDALPSSSSAPTSGHAEEKSDAPPPTTPTVVRLPNSVACVGREGMQDLVPASLSAPLKRTTELRPSEGGASPVRQRPRRDDEEDGPTTSDPAEIIELFGDLVWRHNISTLVLLLLDHFTAVPRDQSDTMTPERATTLFAETVMQSDDTGRAQIFERLRRIRNP